MFLALACGRVAMVRGIRCIRRQQDPHTSVEIGTFPNGIGESLSSLSFLTFSPCHSRPFSPRSPWLGDEALCRIHAAWRSGIQTHVMASSPHDTRCTTHDPLFLSSPPSRVPSTNRPFARRPCVPALRSRQHMSYSAQTPAGILELSRLVVITRTSVLNLDWRELLFAVVMRVLGHFLALVRARARVRIFANSSSLTRVSWATVRRVRYQS